MKYEVLISEPLGFEPQMAGTLNNRVFWIKINKITKEGHRTNGMEVSFARRR